MSKTHKKSSCTSEPRRLLLPLLIAQALASPVATQAATIPVDTLADSGASCTLRKAIVSVNNGMLEPGCSNTGEDFGTDDTITFVPGVEGGTITLTGGALFISKSVDIHPGGTAMTTVDANLSSQGFIVSGTSTVKMTRLAVNNGAPGTIGVSGGGISVVGGANLEVTDCSFSNNRASTSASGGAISLFRAGTLTVTDCTFTGNSGFDQGGAISSRESGDVTITGSTFENNVAFGAGAVAITGSSNRMTITDSTFTGNSSQSEVAAIEFEFGQGVLQNSIVTGNSSLLTTGVAVYGFVTTSFEIIDSTISDNTAAGVFARYTPLSITGSTISGNTSSRPGVGVSIRASRQPQFRIDIENSTISNNSTVGTTSDIPSAVYIGRLGGAALNNTTITGNDVQGTDAAALTFYMVDAAELTNTIVANTPGAPDCSVAFTTSLSIGADSIIENNACGGTPTVTDPVLLPLADNGGPTLTHALGPGSPAIDSGDNATCAATDQRQFPRPAGASCDVGAVESGAGNQPPMAVDDVVSTRSNIPVTFNAAANDVDDDGNLDLSSVNTNCGSCSLPANGNLVDKGNGSFEFTPTLDFEGLDEFIYEICDTDGACDTATVDISVTPPLADVDVKFLLCTDRAEPEALFRYGIRTVNAGPDTAEGVALVHTPPAGATVVAVSPSCVENGPTVECDFGDLQPGESVDIGVEIQAPAGGAQFLGMTAEVAANTEDPNLQDNTDPTDIELVPDLVDADGFETCGPSPMP